VLVGIRLRNHTAEDVEAILERYGVVAAGRDGLTPREGSP
jgi:hypothetical protein